jgi:hypothetical protein
MQFDNDYLEGFRQGVRAVCGNDAPLPALAEVPAYAIGKTPFQVGIICGIEYAKGLYPEGQDTDAISASGRDACLEQQPTRLRRGSPPSDAIRKTRIL